MLSWSIIFEFQFKPHDALALRLGWKREKLIVFPKKLYGRQIALGR